MILMSKTTKAQLDNLILHWNSLLVIADKKVVYPRIIKLIKSASKEARIDENQKRLDRILEWENRTPVPNELTSASFGSAGVAMEISGLKNSLKERIKELKEE